MLNRGILQAAAAFHESISQVAGNDLALGLLRGAMPLIQSMLFRIDFVEWRLAETSRVHADICAAMRDVDTRLAAQRAGLHTNGARQAMLETLKRLASWQPPRRRSEQTVQARLRRSFVTCRSTNCHRPVDARG